MVSLSEDSRHSGGYFFNDDHSTTIQSQDTELLLDHVLLTGESDQSFRKINTVWAIVVEIILSVGLVVGAFVIPALCHGSKCGTDGIALVIYIHGGLWFVMLLFDRYFRQQHYVSRLNGFLEFYRRTKSIRRLPILIASGANSILLIVTLILDEYCPNTAKQQKCSVMKKENYIQIVIVVESVAMLAFLIVYLIRTLSFNRCATIPDVNQDEMLTSFLQTQSHTSDIGFKDENYVDQILEKQADMIRYLKQHNSHLARRVLTLTADNNALKCRT